jgi:hypothetical protein
LRIFHTASDGFKSGNCGEWDNASIQLAALKRIITLSLIECHDCCHCLLIRCLFYREKLELHELTQRTKTAITSCSRPESWNFPWAWSSDRVAMTPLIWLCAVDTSPRLVSWSLWLERLFGDNECWIMLVIIKEQRALIMSRYRSFKIKFYTSHLRHSLHICSFVSCVFFAKNSFCKDLIRIKMSLIREMNMLPEWVHRLGHMTMTVLHSRLLIFGANKLDHDHTILISFGLSLSACSLHSTRRTI